MKTLLSLVFLVLFTNIVSAQKLRVEPSIWSGPTFYEGDKKISEDQMISKLSSDEKAAPFVKNHVLRSSTSFTVGATGSFLVGWTIGSALGGATKPNWVMGGIGALLIGVAVYLDNGTIDNMEKSIEEYNKTH